MVRQPACPHDRAETSGSTLRHLNMAATAYEMHRCLSHSILLPECTCHETEPAACICQTCMWTADRGFGAVSCYSLTRG